MTYCSQLNKQNERSFYLRVRLNYVNGVLSCLIVVIKEGCCRFRAGLVLTGKVSFVSEVRCWLSDDEKQAHSQPLVHTWGELRRYADRVVFSSRHAKRAADFPLFYGICGSMGVHE